MKSTLLVGLVAIAGMAISFQASAACKLVSTVDGTPLNIKVTAEDSDAAKTFLETCKNPYNEIF
ncbi:MAG: cytochrome C, partial [Methylophilaceae bacterium]